MASKSTVKVRELGVIYADENRADIEAIVAAEKALKAERELAEEKRNRKDLIKVDHSTIDYMPFKKNLFVLPRALGKLNDAEVTELRGERQRVRS